MADHPRDVQVGVRLHRILEATAILVLGLFAVFRDAAPAPLTSADITLEGQWRYSYVGYSDVSKTSYTGTVTVDAQGVANLTGTWSGEDLEPRTVSQAGHVRVALPTVEFWFTEAKSSDGKLYNPDFFHCTLRSTTALDCHNVDNAGKMTAKFILRRVETASDIARNVMALRKPLPQISEQAEAKPERLPQRNQSAAPAAPPPQPRPQQATPRPAGQTQQPQETPRKPAEKCTVTRPTPGFQVYLATCPNSWAIIGRTVDLPTGWTVSEGVNATDAIESFMKSQYAR